MAVPLLHFVFGGAGGGVPIKPYASEGARACEAGGLCQAAGCAANAAAAVLPRRRRWRGGGLLRLRGVVGGNQRVAQRKERDCARRPKQRP